MADPKDPIHGDRADDRWGVGEAAGGEVDSMTVDEALRRLGQRQADEEAFAAEQDGDSPEEIEESDDDYSDLEDDDQ